MNRIIDKTVIKLNKVIRLKLKNFDFCISKKGLKFNLFLYKLFNFWIIVIVVFLQKLLTLCNGKEFKKPYFTS